jgi:hypothetical protein
MTKTDCQNQFWYLAGQVTQPAPVHFMAVRCKLHRSKTLAHQTWLGWIRG